MLKLSRRALLMGAVAGATFPAMARGPIDSEFVDYDMPAVPFDYQGKPIAFRLSYYAPATHKSVRGPIKMWLDSIARETQGKLIPKTFFGGSLHKASDGFKALASDITDLTAAYPAYSPSTFHLMHVSDLPFLFTRNLVAHQVLTELYPKYFKSEYEKTGALLSQIHSVGPNNIHTLKPVANLSDLKGRIIRSAGGISTQILKSLGASPLAMPAPEIFTSLQRGVIEGLFFYNEGILNYHLNELVKHCLNAKINLVGLTWGWNPKTWRSFPPEVRKYLTVKQSQLGAMLTMQGDYDELHALKIFEKQGIQVRTLDSEEHKRWVDQTTPLIEEFVKVNAAKRLPAAELVEDVRRLTAKYEKWSDRELLLESINNPVRGIDD